MREQGTEEQRGRASKSFQSLLDFPSAGAHRPGSVVVLTSTGPTDPLRLAYSALVQGAASCSSPENGSLAWCCIQLLVDKINGLTLKPDGSEARSEELLRLRLTLLSTVPSITLPSPFLGQLLSAIDLLIRNESLEQERSTLLAAIYEVILREVGDAEREFVMQWWFALLEKSRHWEATRVNGSLSARL